MKHTQSEFKAAVGKLELRGSTWLSDRLASMNTALYKVVTRSGNSKNELPIKKLSFLNKQSKNDKCGIWCMRAHLHPVKTNACRTKS